MDTKHFLNYTEKNGVETIFNQKLLVNFTNIITKKQQVTQMKFLSIKN